MTPLKAEVLGLVLRDGYERRQEPFLLAQGQLSHDYVDAKRATATGAGLLLAGRALLELAAEHRAAFEAVGGMTMGADPLAHAVAMAANSAGAVGTNPAGGTPPGTNPAETNPAGSTPAGGTPANLSWFSVLKERKHHGTRRRVVGAALAPGTPVLLLDDVATTGASILAALNVVQDLGAVVVLASVLVDRGDATAEAFAARGVAYAPLLTYRDLGIEPVEPLPGAT